MSNVLRCSNPGGDRELSKTSGNPENRSSCAHLHCQGENQILSSPPIIIIIIMIMIIMIIWQKLFEFWETSINRSPSSPSHRLTQWPQQSGAKEVQSWMHHAGVFSFVYIVNILRITILTISWLQLWEAGDGPDCAWDCQPKSSRFYLLAFIDNL